MSETGQPSRRPVGKRLFIGLVLGAACLLCLVLGIAWLIPTLGFAGIHPWLPGITAAICLAAVCWVLWISFGLICPRGRAPAGSSRMRGLSIRLFLPLAEALGRLTGFSTEEVRHSFIKVNNELVLRSQPPCPPETILILLPHCLQASRCPHKITHTPDNCLRCGRCVHADLLALRDAWGVRMAVATGGTIARRIVKELRPRLIIAVACERDLASGIQDAYPLSVYGILNERPNGPCMDTTLCPRHMEEALRRFAGPASDCADKAAPA
jgi:hypothetical protein